MLKKKTIRSSLILLVLIILTFGITGCGAEQPAEVKTEEVEPVAVTVASASKGDLQKITDLSGQVEAKDRINIIPKMGGKVASVAAEIGDKVAKGQVLVRLETKEIQAQLKQSQAAVAGAKAGAAQAQARFEDAKRNMERMKELFQQGAVSQQTLDGVLLQYEMAKTAAAEAQQAQAEAGLHLAETQLENAVISTPISGIIAFRYVNPGDMAGPTSPVITVVNMDTVTVNVNVSESEINSLAVGNKVKVSVPAASQEEFEGEITMVSPAAEAKTKAYPVEISIDNPEHVIKPGMFAQVALGTVSVQDVIVVPQEAVVDAGGKKVVYIAQADKAEQKDVVVGISTGEKAAIMAGLQENDQVIVQGQHRLEHGYPIAVQGGDK